jgi:hypothetical protein
MAAGPVCHPEFGAGGPQESSKTVETSSSKTGVCAPWLLLRAPYLQFIGHKSFAWCPTVHSAAIRTLRKCDSIRQLIDLRQIDIDVRRGQSIGTRTFEHQLRQRSLPKNQ